MPTATRADAEQLPASKARRRAAAALARPPSIPLRRPKDITTREMKRAAVILRRGMRQSEFRHVETELAEHDLICLPVLAGQRKTAAPETPACGLIITGGDMKPTWDERDVITASVSEMLERGAPILAMSDAAELALEAAGEEAAPSATHGVLIHKGVRALKSQKDVSDAIKFMSKL